MSQGELPGSEIFPNLQFLDYLRLMLKPYFKTILASVSVFTLSTVAVSAQMRVGSWNVTNYNGLDSRTSAFQTSFYGVFEGRSFAPDCLLGQEFTSQTGVNDFVTVLNGPANSPKDWAAATFVNGPDTDSAFFYRTSLFKDVTTITVYSPSGGTSDIPRNIQRYDMTLKGYRPDNVVRISMYSTHMKSGSSSSDQQRRLLEAQKVRDDAQALPAGRHFLIGGDFNVQNSSQSAYQELVGSQANNTGRFFDPINTPGNWNNNGNFRIVHTQDPIGAGGMDDRHDQILISANLIDGQGMQYVGNQSIPYSTSTWNDPNHSYRAWGNDGTSFDTSLKTTGNTMVGSAIATALRTTAGNGGHLPIFLDLLIPAQADTNPTAIALGDYILGSTATASLQVYNGVDTAVWDPAAVSTLTYSLSTTGPFTAPAGSFNDAAGGGFNNHSISINTSSIGSKIGTVVVNPNTSETPNRVVGISAFVKPVVSSVITKPVDNTAVTFGNVIITRVFNGYYYVQLENRAAGIRVEHPGHSLTPGRAEVVGVIKTNAAGERYIEAVRTIRSATASAVALGMNNRQLGGGDSVVAGSTQLGVTGSTNTNNVGLLARTWGKVLSVSGQTFVIDDGSGIGVRVEANAGILLPQVGSVVEVTGPCSLYMDGMSRKARLLVALQGDIVIK